MADADFQSGVHWRAGGNTLVIETTGGIVFGEGGNVARLLRVRSTVAAVNAGVTLLAAVPGKAYRLHDASLVAIGGAVTTATSVDIKATQATAAVSLVVGAQANLTQSTLIRAGATGGAILANGASFMANDVNTAITLITVGGGITVATHIDVALLYTLEHPGGMAVRYMLTMLSR